MRQIKWIFIFFAITAAASIMGIGVAIAERSLLGIIFCTTLVIFVMGIGFTLKKKLH